MNNIRVVIADDFLALRDGLKALISAEPDIEVVGEAVDGDQAVKLTKEKRPDVLLLDLTMPKCNGLEALKTIRQTDAEVRVLVLTMHDDQAYLRAVLGAGGSGYVVKHAAGDQLITAIREVHAGRSYINVALHQSGIVDVVRPPPEDVDILSTRGGGDSDAGLSQREQEVLVLVAHGFTHREIGERLGVSKKTVDTYRLRLSEKLKLRTRAELVRYALQHGLLKEAPGGD